jgi:LuxR family transcriptional regulator, maltose regulon positive regulatory protein
MPNNLLETKLRLPPLSPRRVHRPRLADKLNEGLRSGRLVTLVSAPAGFGKSTCVSEWVATLDIPVAWLSLDLSDDEPGRFFTYLFAALQKVDRELGCEIDALLRAGQVPPGDIISATLVNDLLRTTGKFLLVLDDLQVIHQRMILDVLKKLVANLPPALHLVILTREDPPLPLARLRANNLLTEIRAEDLRFNADEAADFLQQGMGLGLSLADITILEQRTEGWVVGLQLAGLSVRDRPDPSRFIATLNGSHRHILNYLTDEVLSHQPEDVQEFLLQTSILERLNGECCDAVTGRTGSQALLDRLYDANLFLIPLDEERHGYRYHHLFADLLRDRLNVLQKNRISDLRRRASQWYAHASDASSRLDEKAAFATEAVRHALAAADYAGAVELIENNALNLIVQWYAKTVENWVASLPVEWRSKSPKTNLAFAWNYLLHGDIPQAAPYIEKLARISVNEWEDNEPTLQAEWLALQAWLINAQGKPLESLTMAGHALEITPETDAYVHCLIHLTLASAYHQLKDYPHAVESYQNLISYGRSAGNITAELLGIAALGQITLFHGQYRFTFDLVSQGISHMEGSGSLHPISTALYGELGEIRYQWNELDQARRDVQRAVEVSHLSGYGHAAVFYNVLLSHLNQRQGHLQEAEPDLQKISSVDQTLEPGLLKEEVAAQQVRLFLDQDRLAEAETTFASLPPMNEEQVIDYHGGRNRNIALRLHLYRGRTGRDSYSLVQGIKLADDLLARILEGGYLPIALETLLLRAQFHSVSGNDRVCMEDMLHALSLGEPEGIIGIFVDEGHPVAHILTLLLERGLVEAKKINYVHSILAAFSQAPSLAAQISNPSMLIEPLTDRELDVLRHMALGKTYDEIAAQLVVSINTIRSHVKSIYGKLGVNNRTAAIETARRLVLL